MQPTLHNKPADGSGIATLEIGQPTQLELQSSAHRIGIRASEIADQSRRSAWSHHSLRRSSLSSLRRSSLFVRLALVLPQPQPQGIS